MVLMQKPSVVDSPSGGAPAKAPRWDLADTEGYGSENCVSGAPWMFFWVCRLIQEEEVHRWPPEGPTRQGARPIGGGGALLSRGGLFLTCTPSPLDHVRSKNHASEGFILFGLHLIFLSFEILKQTKKTAIRAGPPVSRLVPKMIIMYKIKPINIQNR